MTSVFDTPAPDFSIIDAEKIALDHFGINGSAEPLVSDRDQNFRVKSSNEAFVLKIKSEILGGMLIQIGDQIIDGSVKTKLESLRQELKHDTLVSEVI